MRGKCLKKVEKNKTHKYSTIVHLICCEKFTSAYVNFMKMKLSEYCHCFIIYGEKYEMDIVDESNVLRVKSYRNILTNEQCMKWMKDAERIVVSGVFGVERFLCFLPSSIWNKVYLHFWGGDFYTYRDDNKNLKFKVYKYIMRSCIERCKAVITLIADDYLELEKVFHLKKKHYTAAMPENPKRSIELDVLRNINKKETCKRILIGNSATEENQHFQILDILSKFSEEDILIVCPLSYGDPEYRDKVIEYGKKIFAKKFMPIVEYMDYNEYVYLLNSCDIGIFNNNRQQAMGNIWILAELGKKIYLRDDTSMWKHFQNWGMALYSISDIKNGTAVDFFAYTEEEKRQNYEVMDSREKLFIRDWQFVLME